MDNAGDELEALRAALTAGEASDGQHTHNELYEQRMLYHAHAARMWVAAGLPVVKSWRHHDGEECYDGDFFIVVVHLPTGQVSNHYPAAGWDLFAVPEVPLAPFHDGHSPEAAAERLRAALVEVVPQAGAARPQEPSASWSYEGRGGSPADREDVFERYYRLHPEGGLEVFDE